MSAALKKIEQIIEDLPQQQQAEVVDFAEFVRQKWEKQARENETEPKWNGRRVIGLHDGEGYISNDFNDELPDEFWFGEDFGLIEKGENETAP